MINLNKNKILIVRLSSLGDVLLTTPVIRALKRKFAEARIDFLVKEQYLDAVKFNPLLKEKFVYPADNNVGKLVEELRTEEYDFVLDLQNNFRSRAITSKLSTKVYKYKKPSIKKFLLVKLKINLYKKIKSVTQMYAEAVPGLELNNEYPEIFLPSYGKIEKPGNRLAVLCPGSRHFTKMWPAEYFLNLSRLLVDSGYSVYLTGGKDDREICDKIAGNNNQVINYSTDDKMEVIASVISVSDVVVCNDSGLMHLAVALNKPVVAIFGSTVEEFGFMPKKNNCFIAENAALKCRPCSHTGRADCPEKHFKCMKEISPEMIFESLKYLIGK